MFMIYAQMSHFFFAIYILFHFFWLNGSLYQFVCF